MHLKHVASGVAALAMLGLASASEPALAHGHSGHGHPGGGGSTVRAFSGPHHFAFQHFRHDHFRHHHFRHHRRFAFVGAYPDYYYDDDGCSWLRHRALLTGSPYWWHRYHACRYGDDY